jgi:RimJ/RimL family protein N-acetyltransferase
VDSESRTARLLLRRLQENDRDDLRRIHADPRVMATLGGVRSDEQSDEFLRGGIAHWERYVEVAYALLPEFWGRGLATELARESVRTAFEVLGLDDVVCFALPTNRASRRVMEKVGFRYERDVVYHGLPHVFYRLRPGRGSQS